MAGLLDYIVEMIVMEDDVRPSHIATASISNILSKALQLVDQGPFRCPFRCLLKYARPSLKEADIPHHTKIRKEILESAKKAKEHVQAHLQGVKGLVSFTFDTWTSGSLNPYLSVTSHYISAPADRPNDWELMSDQLAFTHIEGSHSGANLSHILVRTV
jgi:hypothetical protein